MELKTVSRDEVNEILNSEESIFLDFKSKRISAAKLTRSFSAFANTSGGELFIGVEEVDDANGKSIMWDGFDGQENANDIFHVIEGIDPTGVGFASQFLKCEHFDGLVLHLIIPKTQFIIKSSDGKVYKRSNASNIPLNPDGIKKLEFDKGIASYEDSLLNVNFEEITNSVCIIEFLLDTIPSGEPEEWLKKQFVINSDRPTVAGVLLFSDNPQALLAKRSAIKILRYKTKDNAERDFLVETPETIEGPIYSVIYNAVDRVKKIIEGIEKVGVSGMERISYPEEALHEIITNAVLHRDYSIAADVQIRIFDNRVEIESPGKLAGHVVIPPKISGVHG